MLKKFLVLLLCVLTLAHPILVYADMTEPITITATGREDNTLNYEQEQYKLIITKDTNTNTTSPNIGEYWYDKDSTVNVSATYKSLYTSNGGTGSYKMNQARTADVKARWAVVLSISGGTGINLEKVRVYSSSTAYTDYTYNFSNSDYSTSFDVYPGCKVVFYGKNNKSEHRGYFPSGSSYRRVVYGKGKTSYFIVPSNATGPAYLPVWAGNTDGVGIHYHPIDATDWARNISPVLGGS